MTETPLVISPSINISQEHIGEFEKNARGIGSKILRKMGYNGQGLGKRRQGNSIPIVARLWVMHEGLDFDRIMKNYMSL